MARGRDSTGRVGKGCRHLCAMARITGRRAQERGRVREFVRQGSSRRLQAQLAGRRRPRPPRTLEGSSAAARIRRATGDGRDFRSGARASGRHARHSGCWRAGTAAGALLSRREQGPDCFFHKTKRNGTKFAAVKKIIRTKTIKKEVLDPWKKDTEKEKLGRNVLEVSSALFFSYNMALGPPYWVIANTNSINFSIQNKLDLEKGLMDCLYAKCTLCITDCVMAELEKLGQKHHVALRIAKDPRFQRLACTHKGTYADDCMVERITQQKRYIVATCDRDLKRRIRKVPGVPIMYITHYRYSIE
ncbi:rRNA-processing protein FCF1 homolog [Triticum aestivum]|uniref:rRNA-processing protein FCF1 homolog n=1 Tax=Triticum aestivum TaxID=4565 RepID=UPI001D01C0F8|nr:rRNA-processing protein FCF1 homolog [Triticum aestivum]